MIEVQNLNKRFYPKKILHNITFNIKQGEIIALLGKNGAGKTTLMKILSGILPPTSGKILLDGKKVCPKDLARFSYGTSEGSFFTSMTPTQHRDFYKMQFDNFNDDRFNKLTSFFNISLNRRLKYLSTGQKAQFETIMALCQGAEYIFLDETFASSDIFVREEFYKMVLGILQLEETIVLSTHLVNDIKNVVSRVLLLDEGRLIGDIYTTELDETETDLTAWLKKQCNWDDSRILKVINKENSL